MTMWPLRATIGRPALRCVCKLKESIHARSSTFFDWGWGFADGIVRQPSESVFPQIRLALSLIAGKKARRDPLCLQAGNMERLRRGMARVARACPAVRTAAADVA